MIYLKKIYRILKTIFDSSDKLFLLIYTDIIDLALSLG